MVSQSIQSMTAVFLMYVFYFGASALSILLLLWERWMKYILTGTQLSSLTESPVSYRVISMYHCVPDLRHLFTTICLYTWMLTLKTHSWLFWVMCFIKVVSFCVLTSWHTINQPKRSYIGFIVLSSRSNEPVLELF